MKKAMFVSLLLLAVVITLSSQLSLLVKLCNLIIGGEPLLEEEIITSRKMRRKRKRHVAAAGPWDEYHNLNASFTFPSVKQRIVYYFGTTWCNETITGPNSIDMNDLILHKIKCNPLHYQHDDQAIMSLSTLLALPADGSNILRNSLIAMYEYLENIQPQTPLGLLLQVGDNMQHQKQISFPLMMKSRKARNNMWDDEEDDEFATEPILLPINFNRHFQPVWDLEDYIKKAKLYAKYGSTRKYPSWDEKFDTILWRGSNTGGAYDHGGERFVFLRKFRNMKTPYHPVSFDIGYSEVFGQDDDIYAPDIMKEMKSYLKNELRISDMVQYKYFLSIEGNDVASDLKWKLYSNSVVFMKPPTKVTWAMEDYLIPWYHYVPLVANTDNDDDDIYPDLMEKLSWAHSHPQECEKIATQSTEYIHRLLISDQAKADQTQILKYMLNSYQERFGNYFYNFCQNRSNSSSNTTMNNNENHNDTLVVIGE